MPDKHTPAARGAPPTLDHSAHSRRRPSRIWRKILVAGAGVTLVAAVLAGLSLSSRSVTRVTTYDDVCRSNLRSLSQDVILYANDHRGSYPRKDHQLFRHFLEDDLYGLSTFVCPGSNQDWTRVATMQEAISEFDKGNLMSYVYAGGALSSESPADAVLFYEPLSHHGDHINVMYNNCRVARLPAEQARKVIAELEAGHNPPRAHMIK